MVWKFADEHAFAVNVTRTQRHPQAAELYADGPHIAAQRFEVGDPNLDLETAITTDVSLRRSGEGVQWTLSAFYNDYSDYIFASPTGEIADDLPVFAYLQDGAKLHGFEAEVIFPLLEQGDGHLDLRLASDYVRGELDDGGDLPQIPPLRFGAGLHYDQDRWHLGVQAFYYDEQDKVAVNELPTDSFTLVDADVSYRLPAGTDERVPVPARHEPARRGCAPACIAAEGHRAPARPVDPPGCARRVLTRRALIWTSVPGLRGSSRPRRPGCGRPARRA